MKRKFLLALAIGAVLTTCLGMTAIPASAAPTFEVCTATSTPLCLNRQGGGTGTGTAVIGWTIHDNNNDFIFLQRTGMCNNGYVSNSMECPFTPGGGLNKRYDGKSIVEIEANTANRCVGDNGAGTGGASLELCPDENGQHGGIGTIFVLAQNGNPTYVVNKYWSNYTGSGGGGGSNPRWMCSFVRGATVTINHDTGSAGTCQWNEIVG
jgi:hypothetical protein